MKMDPKVKALWVASLRDGSFKRGKFKLRDLDERFDPAGVLCELAVIAGVIPPAKRYDNPQTMWFGYKYGTNGDSQSTGLPKAVCKWSGLPYRTAYKVSLMSDEGASFAKVADWIEENL